MEFQSYCYSTQGDRPVSAVKSLPLPILKHLPKQRRLAELEITMRPV